MPKVIKVKHKYKIHALRTAQIGIYNNSTFYETEEAAVERARECIAEGCEGIVVYKAIMVITPVLPTVEVHDVR